MNFSYLRQYRRLSSLIKIILFILIFICSLLLYIQSLKNNTRWCDPEKALWWFCSWPGPETICSWNQHFPTIDKKLRTPDEYAQSFQSLPKLRRSFQFNNLTLQRCKESSSIDLLIFVISKCSHGSIRQSIRRTWGNVHFLEEYSSNEIKLKLLFLVDIDYQSKEKIQLEYEYYQDIVQIINLPEQYHYVTERESALYQFVIQRCQQTKYLFKTDDDIFLNTFLLLSSLKYFIEQQTRSSSSSKYLLVGFPIQYGLVIRHSNDNVGQRYIITKQEYLCSRYPTFLSGFGYLMTFHVASLFFDAYQTDLQPFPLSDVYFTGLIAQFTHLQRLTILPNVDYRYDTQCSEEFFNSNTNPLACAASNDHFNQKQSNGDRSLMNDYNLYWTKLVDKYRTLKINQH